MTNEQKIKAYLAAGHYVGISANGLGKATIVHDNDHMFISSNGTGYGHDEFERMTLEPIPRKPNYKVGDKVVVLDIAREIYGYDDWDDCEKEQVGKVGTIVRLFNDGTYKVDTVDGSVWLPSWAMAPAFDDEKSTKIQELESQLATIAKELELLKK